MCLPKEEEVTVCGGENMSKKKKKKVWAKWSQKREYVILVIGRWQKGVPLCTETWYVWACIYTLLAASALAGACWHRGERIWQACLLSPQNNCLRITWGESRWRCLEMTLPGDSLNHVHIRPGCYFACARACVCAHGGEDTSRVVSVSPACAWLFKQSAHKRASSVSSATPPRKKSPCSGSLSHACGCVDARRRSPTSTKGHLYFKVFGNQSGCKHATLVPTAGVRKYIWNSHPSSHSASGLTHLITLLKMLQTISCEGRGPVLYLMLGAQSRAIKQLPVVQASRLSSSRLHGKETTDTVETTTTRGIWVCIWCTHAVHACTAQQCYILKKKKQQILAL